MSELKPKRPEPKWLRKEATLERRSLVSADSTFKVYSVARLNFCWGSPNQILESNNWLLINRYELDGMRVARDFYDESFFNTSD